LDRVVTSFRPEAKLKSLDMRVVPTRLWAEIAPAILERIMSNLVSNAIKYTPAGVVLLGVRRRGEFAEVLVADTGLGIAEQDLPFIFKDFFQIANPERNRDKGFGLGLGIVRRLSEGMNWSLLVTSKVGRGTTIGVRVPIASDDSRTGVEIQNDIVPCDLRSSTTWVLVLDDDPLVRDAMERLLTDWGLKVALCQTGAEAVAVLHASGPERTWHVLLDYRLAGDETGLEIADRVRAEFGNRVQVTIMSGETNQQLIQATKLRGLTLLRKPVKPIRLRATLAAS
jgi:CheY-like chemotaxis protein/anti-sigma regulatory factor (Ser/Thr protein kinase)